jgi:predicted acyltransferase
VSLTHWVFISIIVGLSIYPLTYIMPFNKKIYSISFMSLTIFFCGMSLSMFVYLLDVFIIKKENVKKVVNILISPLIWLGRNPLIVFVLMYEVKYLLDRYLVFG